MDDVSTSMDSFIDSEIISGRMKKCPFCGIPSELMSGCNYVTCFCKKGYNGKSEYCWLCMLPKYKPDPLKSETDHMCCNDKSHNSH